MYRPRNTRTRVSPLKSRAAFTLIELSIVLVIIGLIVGGVLVGRDLIAAAKIRSTLAQLEQFKVQTNTFKLKFNCLPGDCANATAFITGCNDNGTNICNGNGNGRVDGMVSPYYGETCRYWEHLSRAGLLDSQDLTFVNNTSGRCNSTESPPSKYSSDTKWLMLWACDPGSFGCRQNKWPGSSPENHYFSLLKNNGFVNGRAMDPGVLDSTAGNISPGTSLSIDTKIDDGMPLKGNVLSANSYGLDTVLSSAPYPNANRYCLFSSDPTASPVNYNDWTYYTTYTSDESGCRMIFKSGF